jgi:4,5-dihydroxyphthalate decarboxylase
VRMPALRLTLALNDSDQVRDLVADDVRVEGIALTCLRLPVEEVFFRFARHREWDVSELSLGKFAHLIALGDASLVAIPAFTSRAFRHSAFYVRGDGSISEPADLAGRRIGIPEWTITATVWGRGLLAHAYGVDLREIDWVQAGTNEPGRVEGVQLPVPDGFRITAAPEQTLNDLLLAGEIDAIIAPHRPAEFKRGTGRIVRLFQDFQRVEEDYYRSTGIFPIMHLVAIKRPIYERDPWIAMELLKGFEEAKRRSLERMTDPNAPFTPVPWAYEHARRAQELMGEDLWPYGIKPNRRTLETFLGFAHEQGVCGRLLEPDELFVPEVRESFRV